MSNPADYKEFQILGANLQAILGGFGSFTLLASKIMLETGLGKPDAEGIGMAEFVPDQWYPLDRFLTAFDRVSTEFGDYTLRQVGIHIPKTAVPPPGFWKDIHSAFQTMDGGYHLNHGKDGVPMFNPETGQMTEGIGHMAYTPGQTKKQIIMECSTCYPCAFDEGIVTGLAQRFEASATTVHDRKACRKRGHPSCTYTVNWK